MLYVTYKKDGVIRSASLDQKKYEQLISTPGVSNVSIHPNRNIMENAVNEEKGLPLNNKKLLLG